MPHDTSEPLAPMHEYAGVDTQGAILHDTIGMVQPMSYRNKAQYPVAPDDGKVITGFYAPHSHNVVETDECGIQNGESERVRGIVSRFLNEKSISAYDEVSRQGSVRHIYFLKQYRIKYIGQLMGILQQKRFIT